MQIILKGIDSWNFTRLFYYIFSHNSTGVIGVKIISYLTNLSAFSIIFHLSLKRSEEFISPYCSARIWTVPTIKQLIRWLLLTRIQLQERNSLHSKKKFFHMPRKSTFCSHVLQHPRTNNSYLFVFVFALICSQVHYLFPLSKYWYITCAICKCIF